MDPAKKSDAPPAAPDVPTPQPPATAAAQSDQPAGGAVVLTMSAAATVAAPPARAVARAAALPSRATVAKALFVLGCAAAALALFGMTLNPAESPFLRPCAPTEEQAADLRAESVKLLLTAAAQVLGAALAVIAPDRPTAFFAAVLGANTALHVSFFVPAVLMCHLAGAVTFISYLVFIAMMWVTIAISAISAVFTRLLE